MMNAFYAGQPKDGLVSVHLCDETFGPNRSDRPAQVGILAIWSEVERRKGHAARTLQSLCAAADAHQVVLTLEPRWMRYDTDTNPEQYSDVESDRLEALNGLNLDNKQLAAWYAKYGFVMTITSEIDHPEMLREPRLLTQ